MEKTKIHYFRAWRRRWGFTYGHSFVAVKEYVSRENRAPSLSFIVALGAEQTLADIEKRVRVEHRPGRGRPHDLLHKESITSSRPVRGMPGA